MSGSVNKVVSISARKATLKRKIRRHLQAVGFQRSEEGSLWIDKDNKDVIRELHRPQRDERLKAHQGFLAHRLPGLLKYFAAGRDLDPERISPTLERVSADTWQADLFRLAALTWSVPVSRGFGRRLRYLVWDAHNQKLIGLLAIGDPVFNLSTRDRCIGWNVEERRERLVHLMDAYVLGALPPYSALLAGKMVACLVRSREVYDEFERRYGPTTGIISGQAKTARLLAVTTSSSMGRSSVYNRLKLGDVQYFRPIGYTEGWGHFHIPDALFGELRDYLREVGHPYADQHRFGQGPNWRLRTTRAALRALALNEGVLRHGIRRQVFLCTLASNASEILRTGEGRPDLTSLLSVREIGGLAVDRWLAPRSRRRPEYRCWTTDDLLKLFGNHGRFIQLTLPQAGPTARTRREGVEGE
ncbi:MAG: DUF4338 domain-containing protein [Deltaproteobacteria bacterium]|nr:DUF4338 domain-containing protein [Deltaproteobacteria bacterium]